jgi:hypothetical protein
MPAEAFTRKATTPKLKRTWQHVYDSAKGRGGTDAGAAVRMANAAVKRSARRGARRSRR